MRARNLVLGLAGVALVLPGCSSQAPSSSDARPAGSERSASTPTSPAAGKSTAPAVPKKSAEPTPPEVRKRTPPPKEFRKSRVRVESSARARLVGLDVGKGNGVETITFEFADTKVLPSYDVNYVRSVRPNPEDEPIEVEGNAFLEVGFTFTDPNKDGRLGVEPGLQPDQTIVKETLLVKNLGDRLRFAIGLGKQVDFRARELENPTRLVVEVRTS